MFLNISMGKKSSGILIYRKSERGIEVFLVHPGGPFWNGKEDGAWGIPKGEINDGEDEFVCALRELKEETGIVISEDREFIDLGEIIRKDGRPIHAWAVEERNGDWSGLLMGKSWVTLEWPARSGKKIQFKEVDKVGFFSIEGARKMMHTGQDEFLDRLIARIGK